MELEGRRWALSAHLYHLHYAMLCLGGQMWVHQINLWNSVHARSGSVKPGWLSEKSWKSFQSEKFWKQSIARCSYFAMGQAFTSYINWFAVTQKNVSCLLAHPSETFACLRNLFHLTPMDKRTVIKCIWPWTICNWLFVTRTFRHFYGRRFAIWYLWFHVENATILPRSLRLIEHFYSCTHSETVFDYNLLMFMAMNNLLWKEVLEHEEEMKAHGSFAAIQLTLRKF